MNILKCCGQYENDPTMEHICTVKYKLLLFDNLIRRYKLCWNDKISDEVNSLINNIFK